MQSKPHKFTPEQVEFLEDHVKGLSNKELTELFNNYFGLNLKVTQIKAAKKNRKLSSGLDGRFVKGQLAHNKGKKGVGGHEPTQFKKGNRPHNYKPVGSERVSVDGYVEIKIADPNKWRFKHLFIWEEVNGPIPKMHALVFGDGNKRNISLENLVLVTRKQLLYLNRYKLIANDADLTRTGVIVADLYAKINEFKKSI